MHGKLVSVKPSALQKKRDNRNAVALDSEQNPIQNRDIVKVIDGPHSGRQGEINHLFRNFAFLHSRKMLENGGIFVCKCRHLVLAGGGVGAPGGTKASGGRMNANGMPGFMSPRYMKRYLILNFDSTTH
jgi:transcription elongation factor SPT5